MAARISHAAALEVVSLWAMDQHTNAHLEAQRDGRDLLRAYIAQQAAFEADSVSRVEPGSMQQRLATMTQNNATLSGQLTTLQAELATERARAEEAERQVTELVESSLRVANERDEARVNCGRWRDLLAAANARAARLEELVSNWGDVANWLLGCGWYLPSSVHSRIDKLKEHLSTAPQASTEQAPCRKCGGVGFTLAGTEGDGFSVLCSCQDAPQEAQASTEPIIRPASAYYDTDPRPNEPEPIRFGAPAEPQGHWSDCSDCVRDGGHCKRHPAGPPPVDYVTYEVLIEALRTSQYYGIADRLEKARRR